VLQKPAWYAAEEPRRVESVGSSWRNIFSWGGLCCADCTGAVVVTTDGGEGAR
jgi:hypothetical protein